MVLDIDALGSLVVELSLLRVRDHVPRVVHPEIGARLGDLGKPGGRHRRDVIDTEDWVAVRLDLARCTQRNPVAVGVFEVTVDPALGRQPCRVQLSHAREGRDHLRVDLVAIDSD